MTGDLVVDKQQHRILQNQGPSVSRCNVWRRAAGTAEGKEFVRARTTTGAPSIWELTGIHVHLEGNALLFKSVSLQQDDKRSRFQPQPPQETLEQAATAVMNQPKLFACDGTSATACVEKLVMGTKLKP